MHELIPVVVGAVVGAAVSFIPNLRLRVAALLALCVVAGALVSLAMGELATSLAPLFFSFDALLVWSGALIAVLALSWWRARGATQAARR